VSKLLLPICIVLILGCHNKDKTEPYIEDPLAKDQWYLSGVYNEADTVHINADNSDHKGAGVLVALVDDGLDIGHEDLLNNIGEGSYSYLPEEYNFSDAQHGTACAGIIAAQAGNGLGIRGVAPKSKVIAFNALKAPAISNLADALIREKERVWISSNSWGDFNSWGEPLRLRSLIELALQEGVQEGRGGKGIIYVFSSGNGASSFNSLPTDNVNYSGLVNNRYTIPVCAIDENGFRAVYSEIGATLVVCAPSKGDSDGVGISTTDLMGETGYNSEIFTDDYKNMNYSRNFSGTSASAPMVSGVVAMLLDARPDLGWRDVKSILAKSATMIDSGHADWSKNGAGIWVNHHYGFGLVDAQNAVLSALGWNLYPQEVILEYQSDVDIEIPDNDLQGVVARIDVDKDIIIEFVDIFFDASAHNSIGDLEIVLTSPQGTESVLAEQHVEIFGGFFRYDHWRFGSMRHLDESSKGQWRIVVRDKSPQHEGAFKSWTLKIYGHRKRLAFGRSMGSESMDF